VGCERRMSAAASVAGIQARLEELAKEFQKLEAEGNQNHKARQAFMQQQQETTMVKKELAMLKEGEDDVYKLVGPVLVKQDSAEARANVDKRLEFIKGELSRLEKQLEGIDKRQVKKKEEIMKLQSQAQEIQAKAAQQAQQAAQQAAQLQG